MGTSDVQTKQLVIGRDESNFLQLAYFDDSAFPYAGLSVYGSHPLYISAGGILSLLTGGAERVSISNTGDVGIGTSSPQGALDVSSTTGAFIDPRMTTTQRDALTAVNGMIIYNTNTDQFNFRENGAWVTK